MNPKILLILFLFKAFEGAEVKTGIKSLPFLKWKENSGKMKKVVPISDSRIDSEPISQSQDI